MCSLFQYLRRKGEDSVADDVELRGPQHTNPATWPASQPQPLVTSFEGGGKNYQTNHL